MSQSGIVNENGSMKKGEIMNWRHEEMMKGAEYHDHVSANQPTN